MWYSPVVMYTGSKDSNFHMVYYMQNTKRNSGFLPEVLIFMPHSTDVLALQQGSVTV